MQSFNPATTDPANDILRADRQPLDFIFAPKSVAVIGATERSGSVGRTILWNLISSSFGGTVYPVNPKRHNVLGIKAYPTIASIPEPVDLAIIVTPASTVPAIIGECADVGVKGAIVLSAGFKETGAAGAELERQVLEQVRRGKMRLIGPNCLGLMNTASGLNATFASKMARPGNVGFISQSGALCTAILDWSFQENVGFSSFISIGSMLDVDWGDLIYYLGDDPNTKSIVLYMESIGNARSFISAAREVALTKPIIVIKAGRTEEAAKAAASHTGALTGSDAVLEAAFRRCGVLSVNRISDLFDMAEVFAKQPRPKGPRLAIVTNAGGPGVLATDALIATGGELAELSDETKAALDSFLPKHWSRGNPVDILGDADPERYAKTLDIVMKDPNSDGVMVILTPQSMTDPTATAEKIKDYVKNSSKPILASWMGAYDVEAGEDILNRVGTATYRYPDAAARVFSLMWQSSYNLQGIYETPALPPDSAAGVPDRVLARQILDAAHQEDRTLLTEFESKQLLAAYGIPTVETRIASSEEEAVQQAEAIAYPVVLKLHSKTITHKTDVGGVQLNLKDADAVRQAYRAIAQAVPAADFLGVTVQPMVNLDGYELIIGSNLDPQFGPVILFGSGGQLVEVFQDRAIALPPLNTTLARRMMEQTRIYKALKGVRGRPPADLPALEHLLVRFSQLVAEQRWIKEIDINPLLVKPVMVETESADGTGANSLIALDARIVVHPADVTEDQLPKLAIRPYPSQYVTPWVMRDGTPVTIRPIRPEDEPLMIQFHKTLSERSVYLRYFHLVKLSQRITHDRLVRLCFIDFDQEMALVAERYNPLDDSREILGVGRLSKLHGTRDAEFAMLVSDDQQRQGLGTELLRRLIQIGKDEQLDHITAEILGENTGMQRVCEKLGFHIRRTETPSVLQADILL
ncbi:MAG TPA: bifunctional acetate--CoA ligase family protein/GNAT family N-acetyltransferase [Crinalium sp.]